MTSSTPRLEPGNALGRKDGCCSRLLQRAAVAAVLLCGATLASAQSNRQCSEEFARWVMRSEQTVKTHPKAAAQPGNPAKEACIPSEAARKALLRALAAVRRKCESADATPADAAATTPLVDINTDVIGALPVCVAVAAPAAQARSCLSLDLNGAVYWLSNVNCAGQKVIAVVEIKLTSGVVKCRGHVLTKSAKLGTTKPNINYECVQNDSDCSQQSVKSIFPYCSW